MFTSPRAEIGLPGRLCQFGFIGLAAGVLFVGQAAGVARAQDPIETTTELGITITPDDVFAAVTDQSDFWPAVRRHLESEEFTDGTPQDRRHAAQFIKRVNDHLFQRLFNEDDSIALDLLHYTAARLREYAIFRRLREIIDDDPAMQALKHGWDTSQRRIQRSGPEQAAQLERDLIEEMAARMQARELPPATIQTALPEWQRLDEAHDLTHATAAGQAMIRFELEGSDPSGPYAALMPRVAAAADWAILVQQPGEPLSKEAFRSAWAALKSNLGGDD